MPASKKKQAFINRYNKDNYVKITFRLRKGLDQAMLKCLAKRANQNALIRDALCDNLLKYESTSQDVYEEVLDILEKLRILTIICKGFYTTHVLEVMLKFYNNGVLSLDGLNIVLNEFDYQYVPEFDQPNAFSEKDSRYDPTQILSNLDQKVSELAKHGYNNDDILSALLFMVEGDFIFEDDISALAAAFTGLKKVNINDLENYRHYYNFGSLHHVQDKYSATIYGIIHNNKDDDDIEKISSN